jgi:hypothetical protein
MSDVVYIRPVQPPIAAADAHAMAREAGGCFDLHRVDWVQSYLSAQGDRMLCWYRAADTESVRLAMRQLGADLSAIHPVKVFGAPDENLAPADVGLVAEWQLNQGEDALAILDILPAARAFATVRGDRLISIFGASDEARLQERLAGIASRPSFWACNVIRPDTGLDQANRNPG